MKGKKVSIVTPCYNAEYFLVDTIDSILSQTYQHWELILVDDLSTDGTRDIIKEYEEKDKRIHSIFLENNRGPGGARNAALNKAQGQYIAFLDSDDIWLPEKLESQLDFMVSNKADFSFTAYRRFGENQDLSKLVEVPKVVTYNDVLKNTAIFTSTVILSYNAVRNTRMKDIYCHDYVFWLEILEKGYRAYGLNKDLMRYRVVEDSFSRNKVNALKNMWDTYRNILGLSKTKSAYYFSNYAINAIRKYS